MLARAWRRLVVDVLLAQPGNDRANGPAQTATTRCSRSARVRRDSLVGGHCSSWTGTGGRLRRPACFQPERGLNQGTRLAAATGTWTCFEDEAEQKPAPAEDRGLAPPRAYPRGHRVRKGLGPGVAEGWSASSPGRIRVSTVNLRLLASLHTIHTSSAPDLRTPGQAHSRADLPRCSRSAVDPRPHDRPSR